jgi:hypothetical protein
MLGTQYVFADCQRAFVKQPRSRKIAFGPNAAGEADQATGRMWMIGAKYFFSDHQRAFVKRSRSRKITLGLNQQAEIAEACECIEMFGTERLLK